MAKGIREKIKLVSSAGTGHFYTTTKNKRTKPEKLELKNSIQLYASTYCTKKLKSNNFSFDVAKTSPRRGFCFLAVPILMRPDTPPEILCLNYLKSKPVAVGLSRIW